MNMGHLSANTLKREREIAVSLRTKISAATRIDTRFLTAIEEETMGSITRWGISTRLVRAVEPVSGAREENIVAEYAAAQRSSHGFFFWLGRGRPTA